MYKTEWQDEALKSFQEILPKRGGQPIAMQKLITVVEGAGLSEEQQQAQIKRSLESGTAGYVLSRIELPQSWEPRHLDLSPSSREKK